MILLNISKEELETFSAKALREYGYHHFGIPKGSAGNKKQMVKRILTAISDIKTLNIIAKHARE